LNAPANSSSRPASSSLLTRRQWLGNAPAGAIALGLLGSRSVEAQTPQHEPGNDLGARVYNIRDFGAKGDGKSLDTAALQSAIDTCTRDGGGTVLVPAGTFQIGTTELKSNVTLHIAAGATLLGSADGTQYHAVDAIPLHGDTTLVDGNWALLFAVKAKNVTIEGPGTIDGQG
jgi:polygalacturonase